MSEHFGHPVRGSSIIGGGAELTVSGSSGCQKLAAPAIRSADPVLAGSPAALAASPGAPADGSSSPVSRSATPADSAAASGGSSSVSGSNLKSQMISSARQTSEAAAQELKRSFRRLQPSVVGGGDGSTASTSALRQPELDAAAAEFQSAGSAARYSLCAERLTVNGSSQRLLRCKELYKLRRQ